MDKEHVCKCSDINWSDKFKEEYVHDDTKCNCCFSKMNRKEITYETLIKSCLLIKKRKHIYPPCTW